MRSYLRLMTAAAFLLTAGSAWSIPWMYQPTNQHGSLGNNYDEFQNYGGTPYFHDGIDVMQNTGNVQVYSSSTGYLTHTTTGTQYGGLMIGDTYTAGAPGWLYWHIPNSTWQFSLGQAINTGAYIGNIATWPVSSFHHVHFDKVVGTGGIPWNWYQPTGNPLDYLVPNAESTPPEIHYAQGTNLLAFCNNNTSTYVSPSNLTGTLDIIAMLGDHIFNTQWECVPSRITYSIRGGAIYNQFLAFQFSDPLPGANYTAFCPVVYKDDATCNTEGNYNYRNFYFVLTNNDGDSIIETTDVNGSWNTSSYPAGTYTIAVRVQDAGGNVNSDSMTVWVNMQAPALDVTMTPVNPPIIVPANGGSFNFNATVMRNLAPQTAFWAWARDRYPDGTYTGSLLGPVNINPPVGLSVTRTRTQVVPSGWPAGIHYLIGYAHSAVSYPATDADSFFWTKSVTADGGAYVWEAANYGEEFPYQADGSSTPQAFALIGASPNPFNPSTAISYELRAASYTSLKVYDTSGRLVTTLVNGWREAGSHQVTFDGSRFAAGVYLVQMQAGDFSAVEKVMLVK